MTGREVAALVVLAWLPLSAVVALIVSRWMGRSAVDPDTSP